jgi:hypothetical protein
MKLPPPPTPDRKGRQAFAGGCSAAVLGALVAFYSCFWMIPVGEGQLACALSPFIGALIGGVVGASLGRAVGTPRLEVSRAGTKQPFWSPVPIWVPFVILSLLVLGLIVLDIRSAKVPPELEQHSVRFVVTGDPEKATVRYTNASGGTSEVEGAHLTWDWVSFARVGDSLHLSAESHDPAAGITCAIEVEGEVVATDTSGGLFTGCLTTATLRLDPG